MSASWDTLFSTGSLFTTSPKRICFRQKYQRRISRSSEGYNNDYHRTCTYTQSSLQAKNFLNTIYTRILKHKVGWKKASYKMFNQKWIIDQMNEVMMIYTMENLQLNDLSSSQYMDPTSVASSKM